MLFVLSFIVFVVYTALLFTAPALRWIGWVASAVLFALIALGGEALQGIFNMEQDSNTFFYFIAVFYSVVPLIAGEIVARFMGGRKKHVLG